MSVPKIRLNIEGYRAIQSADIALDGITVVAGVNGCGKSTISKLLYRTYKTTINFNELVGVNLATKLRRIERFFDIIYHELFRVDKNDKFRLEFRQLRDTNLLISEGVFDDTSLQKYLQLIEEARNAYYRQNGQDEHERSRNYSRIKYIVQDILESKEAEDIKDIPFETLSKHVESLFNKSIDEVRSRPKHIFLDQLRSIYTEAELPKKLELLEVGDRIAAIDKDEVSIPYLVDRAVYIETHTVFDSEDSTDEMDDLDLLLRNRKKSDLVSRINTIKDEILGGSATFEEKNSLDGFFHFRTKEGRIYDLLDCASGVKAFSILQLLLDNGSLTDKTLLIIDEPESNLHPQWIVEYARVIVLLNKELGVKFLLASHNPDMVSAIKYISQKEGIEENLNFYLAQKQEAVERYNYLPLGKDIEPIFESFNIAFERINQYGT